MSEITCGLFIISEGKLLVAHPTGGRDDHWTIPKGLCDESDVDHISTAVREVEEETGLKINLNEGTYSDLGLIKYKKRNKILHAFIFFSNKDLTKKELKCESMVQMKDYSFPEVDKFKWIDPKEDIQMIHESQQNLLTNFMSYAKEI